MPDIVLALLTYSNNSCTFTPEHGKKIGWKPQFAPEHIIETADEEVELILEDLEGSAGDNSRLLRKH